MTNFGKLFKVFNRSKFSAVNQLMLIELAAIAVSLIWTLVSGHMSQMNFLGAVSGWSGLVYIVGFVLIARQAEMAFTRDTYRLIPAKNVTFYVANLVSSLVMFLYLILLQVGLHLIGLAVAWRKIRSELGGLTMSHPLDISAGDITQIGLTVTLLVLTVFVLALTTVTLIHLTVSATNNFLPAAGKRVVDAILYIVVILLVMRVGVFLFAQLNQVMTTLNVQGLTNMVIPLIGMLVVAALESLISVFLMKRWVETVAN